MKKKPLISMLLVFAMLFSLLPAAAFAADGTETAAADASAVSESPYTQGPKGDSDVAVLVYGQSVTNLVQEGSYSFDSFVSALKAELQGYLANEKLPDVDMYLVDKENDYEYKLTKDAVEDAAFLSSFKYTAYGVYGWSEYVLKLLQTAFGWALSDVDTVGQFYKIYGATDVPEGDYTLEIRQINGDGYKLWQPESGELTVHVGDSHVNYVGYEAPIGKKTTDIGSWQIGSVELSLPGVFLKAEKPGFSFRSTDLGGNALPGTTFTLVNRDEVEKIVKASVALGKDTFTNAMNLYGTEGFTWDDLNVLDKELLQWDSENRQITLNDEAAYKLLATYWALLQASATDPLITFFSNDTDIRLPAILQATADENGIVSFNDDKNVTLIWSMQILLKLSNLVLNDLDDIVSLDGMFADPSTQAIVELTITIAKYLAREGQEYLDENGDLAAEFINTWIYPILQNDSVMEYATDTLKQFVGDDLSPEMQKLLEMLPKHAILTRKMPAGNYIMFESSVPDGYACTPLYYTMKMEWNTESQNIGDWCHVSVGDCGILLPYYAEQFYTYLRQFDLGAAADSVLDNITAGRVDSLIQDTLSGKTDVTAAAIGYQSYIIYYYMGGNLVYDTQAELAADLTKYLYAYGRTSQNMMMFADKVMKEAKGVVTSEISEDWTFYTISTSLRTNIALSTKAIINNLADSIDTTDNQLLGSVKQSMKELADKIDTENHIQDQTTELKNKVDAAVKDAASSALKAGMKAAKSFVKWLANAGK